MSPNSPSIMQNPSNNIYYSKPCNNDEDNMNRHRTKGLSFLALVFFVFFYVCVFNVFNVSPLDVVNDGRFLFFLSNTLIMILAADFGAFTSSSSKVVNVYESDGKVPAPCKELMKLPVAAHAEADDTKELTVVEADLPDEEQLVDAPPVPATGEEVKLLTYHDVGACGSCGDIRANDYEEELEEMAEEGERVMEKRDEEDDDESSQKSGEELNKRAEEEDEFSRMSDEELNKRVEEFIWRLKTQIRLQAARDTE